MIERVFFSKQKDMLAPKKMIDIIGGDDWVPVTENNLVSMFYAGSIKIPEGKHRKPGTLELEDIPEPTMEELKEIEIQWRNNRLSSTDEFGLNDYPDNDLRASMRSYRQLLRDYPSIEGFGDSSLRPIDPRN